MYTPAFLEGRRRCFLIETFDNHSFDNWALGVSVFSGQRRAGGGFVVG